jgi:hypothetical protein
MLDKVNCFSLPPNSLLQAKAMLRTPSFIRPVFLKLYLSYHITAYLQVSVLKKIEPARPRLKFPLLIMMSLP